MFKILADKLNEDKVKKYWNRKVLKQIIFMVIIISLWFYAKSFCNSKILINIINAVLAIFSIIGFIGICKFIIECIKAKEIIPLTSVLNKIITNPIIKFLTINFVKPKDSYINLYINKNFISFFSLLIFNFIISTSMSNHLSNFGISINPIPTILNLLNILGVI